MGLEAYRNIRDYLSTPDHAGLIDAIFPASPIVKSKMQPISRDTCAHQWSL